MRVYQSLLIAVVLLAGCATANTNMTSVVSSQDIPANKYRKIVVFVENLDPAEQSATETIVASALHGMGVESTTSTDLFQNQTLGDDDKAALIQKMGFDAALFVTVMEKDVVLEPAPDVTFDGQMFHTTWIGGSKLAFGDSSLQPYAVTPDGGVVRQMLTFVTQSELQDVRSAKQVWAGNTTASINGKFSNMKSLVEKASKQIVQKMHADNAI